VLSVRDGLCKQHSDVIVVEGIDDAPAPPLTDDEPKMTQHPKLLGNSGLLHLNVACQLTHRARPSSQAAQNSHPAGAANACIVSATVRAVSESRNAKSVS
jgi:hypothetical protein